MIGVPTAGMRDDAESALEEAKEQVEAGQWEAGKVACREALRLVVKASMTAELSVLEELERRVREGEARSREQTEGLSFLAKAREAVAEEDFEGARGYVRDAQGAFHRGRYSNGTVQLEDVIKLIETGEKNVSRRREGEQSLKIAKVKFGFHKYTYAPC